MKKTLVNGLMKALFAAAVAAAVTAVSPKNAEAAAPKMSSTKMTVTAGERFTLTVKNAGKKTINWTSSKTKIATVTKNGGNVVTKKKGTATITATVGNKKVKCKVTVKAPAAKPYLTATSKTLRVGESFLLIEGWYTDYESTFSYNDRIATINNAGRVVATGIGTTKVFVNRGKDSQGRFKDYICTIKVVAGKAPACKHQWMDVENFNSKGVPTKSTYVRKTSRTEANYECTTCGEKFLTNADYTAHVHSTGHLGCMTDGGSTAYNMDKFNLSADSSASCCTSYCRLCGETK